MTEKNSKERARLHTANLGRIAAVKGAPRETTMSGREEATALRKLVREYLDCISHVPMRAVDCNQDLEESLRANLAKAANYRGEG